MNDQVRLNHFFSVLREKRKAFADNYAYFAPKLAPHFNSFNFIRPDELKLSEILAMLLNPKGHHEQGDLFLKLFFTEIEITYPNDTTNIKVGCEVSTDRIENTARRIDIEVNFGHHFGLAIENKPWADDQDKQLSDYAKQMGEKFENWCLIYLSGRDTDPKENSATSEERDTWRENEQYRKINFGDIVKWLKNCEAQCQADHVRHFLRDFIGYCENEFLGGTDMIDANLIKNFALQNENLELALAVGQQIILIKQDLLKTFIVALEAEFKVARPDWTFNPDKNFSSLDKWKAIKFYNPSWKNYYLAINFERTECDGFMYGIHKVDEKTPDLPERTNTVNDLNDKLKKSDKKSSWWWSWSCYFPEPYKDWSKNIEPWLAIQSEEGEMAKIVIAEIVKLAEASQDIIDEAERAILSKPNE
jgi:hypothetical protein